MVWSLYKHQGFFGQLKLLNKQINVNHILYSLRYSSDVNYNLPFISVYHNMVYTVWFAIYIYMHLWTGFPWNLIHFNAEQWCIIKLNYSKRLAIGIFPLTDMQHPSLVTLVIEICTFLLLLSYYILNNIAINKMWSK